MLPAPSERVPEDEVHAAEVLRVGELDGPVPYAGRSSFKVAYGRNGEEAQQRYAKRFRVGRQAGEQPVEGCEAAVPVSVDLGSLLGQDGSIIISDAVPFRRCLSRVPVDDVPKFVIGDEDEQDVKEHPFRLGPLLIAAIGCGEQDVPHGLSRQQPRDHVGNAGEKWPRHAEQVRATVLLGAGVDQLRLYEVEVELGRRHRMLDAVVCVLERTIHLKQETLGALAQCIIRQPVWLPSPVVALPWFIECAREDFSQGFRSFHCCVPIERDDGATKLSGVFSALS